MQTKLAPSAAIITTNHPGLILRSSGQAENTFNRAGHKM